MTQSIQCVHVVTKTGDPRARSLGHEVELWLRERDVQAHVSEDQRNPEQVKIMDGCDLALVLGGDGTMISVARAMGGKGIPLLGLNLGRVGFLTDMGPEDWRDRLAALLKQDLEIDHRLALGFELRRDGKTLARGRGVNDLVISRGAMARLVNLELSVDETRLGLLRADGLILCTPTGATGYSVSARGPLLHPDLPVFGVTPICPFLREFHPMVLPGEVTLRACLRETTADVFLTVDGQEMLPLQVGDELIARRSPDDILLARLPGANYFHKLRAKGIVRAQASPHVEKSGSEYPGKAEQ